jgi:hypothetical protein
MKTRIFNNTSLAILVLLCITAYPTDGYSWSFSTHAYVAKKALELDGKPAACYNAKMGALVPDFFWYLGDFGQIDGSLAYRLHGVTEQPGITPETTFFYEIASGNLKPWNYRLRYFSKGILTHLCADIEAHNTVDGYVEKWTDILAGKIEDDVDREVLHLVIEFSIDSLLVNRHGLQIGHILFSWRQARFVEKNVEEAAMRLGLPPLDFDIRLEFKRYLALSRILEKAAFLYAPSLIAGRVDMGIAEELLGGDLETALNELSNGSLDSYLDVLMILINYPGEILDTIDNSGDDPASENWKDALQVVIDDSCI